MKLKGSDSRDEVGGEWIKRTYHFKPAGRAGVLRVVEVAITVSDAFFFVKVREGFIREGRQHRKSERLITTHRHY